MVGEGEIMWMFYHDIVSHVSDTPVAPAALFAVVVLLTGVIILAPSYFERRQK